VQKSNSSRTSKQTYILHTPSNSPFHPPFLEALYFPSKMWVPLFFIFFPSPLLPTRSPACVLLCPHRPSSSY
jgi:hypothetical protein